MRTILQFSGGQDSIALLYLMEPFWDDLTVVWADAGDASPALRHLIDQVEDRVPVKIVRGDVLRNRELHGDPTDEKWMYCCSRNIWMPMHDWLVRAGVKHIVRGAKRADPVNVIQPGTVDVNGILYSMPLWEWSDEQVQIYIRDRPLKPVYPHDCQSCPAKRPCDRPLYVA